jgi:hypothetical protein
VECDHRGTGDPSISIGEEDGAVQADPAAGNTLPLIWVVGAVYSRESRVIYFYTRMVGARDDGIVAWQYIDWIVVVASVIITVDAEILANALNLFGDRCDFNAIVNETVTGTAKAL